MTTRAILFTILAGLLGTACSRSDSGTGSRTLLAIVEIQASADSTVVEAQLSLRGAAVMGADVHVTNVDTGKSTPLEGRAGGLYRTVIEGYARTLSIGVSSGSDRLEATIEGPAPHVITRPPEGALVRRGGFDTLKIAWDSDDIAEHVDVAVGAVTTGVEGDVFEADLPLAPITDGDHTVSVTREISIDLAGGVAGSRMRSRYKVDNRFTLEG